MTDLHTKPQLTTIEVRNPADGMIVGTVSNESPDSVAAKAAELRRHQPEWEEMGPRRRQYWLLEFQDWILDHAAEIADVVQSETGKVRTEAEIEAPMAADVIKYWAGHAEAFLADEHPKPHNPLVRTKRLTTVYRPYPVVGVISPWNLPFIMPLIDLVPALAAGASVLLKPSEVTPLSAVEIARGWAEIGAPPVLSIATGTGGTGAAVVNHCDYIHFTGSTATGRKVAIGCAERLIPYSLELGGKDPAIVLADADLERAANGVTWGAMFNAGQACISVERVYVEEPVYDEFVALLTGKVNELRAGRDDRGFRYDVGALATPAQRDIVTRHVDEAVAAGARVTTGGKATGIGTFFEPTVLADVDHSMACMTAETFGPTVPVVKVADENEAIRLANDSSYGLSGSVWTRDVKRGEQIARRMETGTVNVNDVITAGFNFALPFGGWKNSGIGSRSGGAHGIRKYCRVQAIAAPRIPTQSKEVLWFPYTRTKTRMALGVIRAAAARGRRRFGITPKGGR